MWSDTPLTFGEKNAQTLINQYIKTRSKDDLYLDSLHVTSLPDNLTVGGDLGLARTSIFSLPKNLTVKRDLNLAGTFVSSLPNDLTVGGNLLLHFTPLANEFKEKNYTQDQLKQMFPKIQGKIRF